MSEELVSAKWKTRKKRFFLSPWNKGIITIEKYEKLKDTCEFMRSVSWKGKYNLNFNK